MRAGKLIMVICLFTGLISACEEYSDGINTDPNNFTDTSEELLIIQAELQLVESLTGEASHFTSIFSDQYTGSELQWESYENYEVASFRFNGIWEELFTLGYNQADLTREKARGSGNMVLEGIAEIHMAAFIGEAALLFGDIPFKQANKADLYPYPQYDPQTEVLEGVQELLQNGVDKVGDAGVQNFYGGEVYLANSATWEEIAFSLKARYYLAAGQYDEAYNAARRGIVSPEGDLLSAHSADAGGRNRFFAFNLNFPNYITAANSHMRKLLTGEVPRVLGTLGDASRAAVYFDDFALNTNPGGYFAEVAPGYLVTWLETRLIEAEAAVRTGRDGLAPFNKVRAYLSELYDAPFPASAAAGDELLYQILEEKYLSLVGQLSVFSDLRRTKNLIGVPIKNVNAPDIPQRFLYPQNEIDANLNFPGVQGLYTPTPVNEQ
jgi:hypothetical protein